MDFFEHPSIIQVSEDHAEQILSLTEDESERIMKAYTRVRQKLRDRLEVVPRGTFTRQRVSQVMVQVNGALDMMGENLGKDMSDSAQSAAEMGITHLINEIQEWDSEFTGTVSEIDLDTVKVATDTTQLLVNNYQASIDAYTAQIRQRIGQGLMDGVIAQSSSGEIIQDLGKTLVGEEWRLRRIVRTELQGIYSRGKLDGMGVLAEDDIPDLMKTIYNPMDNRTANDSKFVEKQVQAGNRNLIVKLDDFFEYTWAGKTRRYLAPPDRPNDRSILIPYRKAWAK